MDTMVLLSLAGIALLSLAAPTQGTDPDPELTTVFITGQLGNPTSIVHAPGDDRRLFVTTSSGKIRLVKDGVKRPTPFLDLSGIPPVTGEGLQCMAFHPDYQNNGRFFVLYQDTSNDSWLVEYAASADPDAADPSSAVVLRGPVPQLDVIHNWDCIQFGPDGKLYLSTGDGGGAFDPSGHSQDIGVLYGKLLRLDVDIPAPHIPPDNPFVGVPGAAEEIWSYGLRQPWRFTFDSATGDIYIGDVGEGLWEEIDFQPASSTGGENYGWPCMEGANCTGIPGCGCNEPTWTTPILDYQHNPYCAVIGGYVYRGRAIPPLRGTYFYADFCTGIFSFRYDGASVTDQQDRSSELQPCDGHVIQNVTSWGQDLDGELYLLDKNGGELFKVVTRDDSSFNYCAANDNSSGTSASIGHVGSTSVTANDFELTVTGAPPAKAGIFFYGSSQIGQAFGDGVLCVGGGPFRLNPLVFTDPTGAASYLVDLDNPPNPAAQILPGSVWRFQFWYRDPAGGSAGFNLSDGLCATFCP